MILSLDKDVSLSGEKFGAASWHTNSVYWNVSSVFENLRATVWHASFY